MGVLSLRRPRGGFIEFPYPVWLTDEEARAMAAKKKHPKGCKCKKCKGGGC